jgi:GrpB-like predicted nucleotidyltransferase (UPF0157 family)
VLAGAQMIGLARGTVKLYDHQAEWEAIAKGTIDKLKEIFGTGATDIQHVGSTSIVHIKAKPIIDIAVAVKDFDKVLALVPVLEKSGFYHRAQNDDEPQIFFSCDGEIENTRTHHIHVVKAGSKEWLDYICFRDYLNAHYATAKEYEQLKLQLMEQHKNNRAAYTEVKTEFINKVLSVARAGL